MPLILTLLASFSLVAFCVALATGAFGAAFIPGLPGHLTLGIVAALLACTVHCMVFTYFLGTGLSIKEAVNTYGLGPEIPAEVRRLKMVSSPPLFGAILLLLFAVLSGGFVATGRLPAIVHGLLASAAALYSVVAFFKEFGCIRDNVDLLAKVKGQVTARAATQTWPPVEADMSRVDQGRALIFFGFSAAFAYVYLRYITRTLGTPLLPFALTSILAIALGTMILRAEGKSR